ncbi:MAG TPA: hypothetical protein VKE96_02070 [Vicinamibacterales bacterium]|nr:hypothetical protein [Vicinamibacterales bacterium]
MRLLRRIAVLAVLTTAPATPALGQPSRAPAASSEPAWSWGISGAWYMPSDDSNFVQPTVTADRSSLHLETRYAYEDRKSLSFFAGRHFEFGNTATLTLTPMIGGLVGHVDGVIPALELDFGVWRIEAYGEAEYVFDLHDSSSQFFYMWSELSLRPTDWLRAGVATQRTRVYHTERDVQRGPLVGLSFSKVDATLYLFNLGERDRLAVLSVGLSF